MQTHLPIWNGVCSGTGKHKPMKKPLLAFALLILAIRPFAMAQSQILREKTESLSLLMKYDGGGTSQGIVNNLIYRLSQGNKTDVRRTEFVLVTEEYSRVSLRSSQTLDVYIALKDMRISGAKSYRGFDMSVYLLPTGITANIQRTKNGVNMDTKGVADAELKGNPAVYAEYTVTDTAADIRNSEFKVILRDFVYSRGALERFEAQCNTVDSYFNSIQELEQIYLDLRKLNSNDIDGIQAQSSQLKAIEDRILAINNREYEKKLGISPANDPAKFLAKLNEVSAYAQQQEDLIAQTMAELPARYHARGMDHLRLNHRDAAFADFQKAISLNAQFAPSHYQLARMDFEAGRVKDAQTRAENVVLTMNPDPQTRGMAIGLLENIANAYVNTAREANKKGKFEAAIASLNEATQIAAKIPELNVSGVVTKEYGIAYNGLYAQYLQIGEQALAAGQLQTAENEATRAIQFQQQHQDMLSPEPASNLMMRVKQAQYADHKRVGREALDLTRYREALERLEAAQALEGQYGIPVDPFLPLEIRTAARPLILEDAKLGTNEALANRLAEARKYADKVKAAREKYGLQEDAELDAAVQELNQRIFNQECINAQNELNAMLQSASAQRSKQDFLGADMTYAQAIDFVVANAQCGLSDQAARAGKAEIQDAVNYQKQLLAVNDQIAKGEYQKALDGYEAAGRFLEAKNLLRFGLAHKSLMDFMRLHQNSNWVYFVALKLADRKDFENSLELVRKLAHRGYVKSQIKALQLRLGSETAIRDHADNISADPVLRALGYTQGDKKLKYFVKGYKKQWKKM